MNDYISRQDVIDMLEMYPFTEYGEYEEAREVISRLPSAQPEIIRCGECMHKDKKIDYCHYLGITICESDYCSYAERRADG